MKELSVCQYFMRIVLIFYCGLPEVFQYVLLQVETYDLLVGNSVPLCTGADNYRPTAHVILETQLYKRLFECWLLLTCPIGI